MAPENEKIQIKFTEIDIESSSDCSKDAIVLEDAANQISHQQVPVRHDEANSSLILSSNRQSSVTRRWLTVSELVTERVPEIWVLVARSLCSKQNYLGTKNDAHTNRLAHENHCI